MATAKFTGTYTITNASVSGVDENRPVIVVETDNEGAPTKMTIVAADHIVTLTFDTFEEVDKEEVEGEGDAPTFDDKITDGEVGTN